MGVVVGSSLGQFCGDCSLLKMVTVGSKGEAGHPALPWGKMGRELESDSNPEAQTHRYGLARLLGICSQLTGDEREAWSIAVVIMLQEDNGWSLGSKPRPCEGRICGPTSRCAGSCTCTEGSCPTPQEKGVVKWRQTDLGGPRGHVAGMNQRPHGGQETNMPCRVTVTTVWRERVLEPWEDTCAES